MILLFLGEVVLADEAGDQRSFFIDSHFDESGRNKATAVLIKKSEKLYFYVDAEWYGFSDQNLVKDALNSAVLEFENRIYPILTSTFGKEWNPGVDLDSKITILIHPMKAGASGYYRTNDEYQKIQITDSNEREMFYIGSDNILSPNLKAFVAHEFMHLITFNQKNKILNIEEDTWLNEARAEYASTLLGYNNNFPRSYLEERVRYFSEKLIEPLIDWKNTKYDYASASLFIHYLIDHYGINILTDSLHSSKIGIDSLNYALEKNGFKENFAQIFSDWIITVLINDCNYGAKYCYLNDSLRNFNLVPQINFLPPNGNIILSVSDNLKNWSANWYKIIGGNGGALKFYFEGDPEIVFNVKYITKNKSGAYIIKSLSLNKLGRGDFYVDSFGKDIISLFIVPYLRETGQNRYYSFFWSASMSGQQNSADEINRLLSIIDNLKRQINAIIEQNNNSGGSINQSFCAQLNNNLYLGMSRNEEVKCLQTFLKSQGADIYPEGLVTGNFRSLTKAAVIKFQEKYAADILTPIGLSRGTGYVGNLTRAKINQILKGN